MKDLKRFFEALFPQYRNRIRRGILTIPMLQRMVYRTTCCLRYRRRRS